MRVLLRLALALTLCAGTAVAHETTRSYLTLERDGAALEAELRLAFRDIEVVVWMDGDLDGRLTWGEVAPQIEAVQRYAAARLDLAAGGACTLSPGAAGVSREGGIAYLDLAFSARCPGADAPLRVGSTLFSDIDPSHRLYLTASDGARAVTTVVGTEPVELAPGAGAAAAFAGYLTAGATHMLEGADHILFLLVLILPAALGSGAVRPRVLSVVAAVTGFTIAHALTLTAAATELLRPPASIVEALIAGSILLTAADNVRPFLPGPRTAVAAFFGTIHGFGFATVLSVLPLGGAQFALALVGFNLGVEIAQVAVVLLAMPALAILGGGRLALILFSAGAGLVALAWLWERLPALVALG